MILRLIAGLAFVLFLSFSVSAQTKLLRFPDIHGDKVVFSYGGDLWTASSGGGTAIRLTAHPGVETFPKFSPDGKWIAFTGQYDGDEQVYVIPAEGGEPRQLTFYPSRGPLAPRWGYDNQVFGWTNDNKVYFRGLRYSWSLPIAKLFTVSATGGPVEPMPMPEAGSGDISPDGTKMVYSPQSRDFRPEKRYAGGQANQLYLYDLATNNAEKISDNPRANRDAMWIGNTIYFNSDRDGKFNLYSYDTSNKRTTQITKNRDWDIRWPSSDNRSRIIYEKNGELEILDTNNQRATKISINVPNDGLNKRPRQVSVANMISGYGLSPNAERALFAARGDIYTAPIEHGSVRNLTNSSDAHDKMPSWSPNGRYIAYISDKTGEEEVWIINQNGNEPAVQLTTNSGSQRYNPTWSKDSKNILFSDNTGTLRSVNIDTKQIRQIATVEDGMIGSYSWSPSGKYVSYSRQMENGMSGVYIWDADSNRSHRVTPAMFAAFNPAWDPKGDYLYFISDREFAPQISQSEFNFATDRMRQIYAIALRNDVKHPFPERESEVNVEEEKPTPTPTPKKDEDEDNSIPVIVRGNVSAETATAISVSGRITPIRQSTTDKPIDFTNIERHVAKIPLPAANYGGLSVNDGHLIYSVSGPGYYGRGSGVASSLRIFSLTSRTETTLQMPGGSYAISANGRHLMSPAGGGNFAKFEASPLGERFKTTFRTNGLVTVIDPAQEWKQIFNEAWRRYRDWFYVENMHGFNWEQIRKDYEAWLPHVSHRADLNYLIAEMSSELTVQHAYIDGGDMNLPSRIQVALPGARFEADKQAGRYRISKIFLGQNEEDIYRSPLTEIGVDAKVGDYVLAINGEEVKTDKDIYAYLRGKAGNTVTLKLNSKPELAGARDVKFDPITSESDLEYLDWIETNRQRVSDMTNGRVGYIHIPDMGAAGIREFIKWYYPQLNKEGLVVDVRANGGGNVSRMLIERLRRQLLGVNFRRGDKTPSTYPDGVFIGPMAAILNENSASDGDIFPYMFRKAGLGPLIGKRSWGGVVGITNRGNLLDGGVVNVPEFALADTNGQYIIEGYGVDPDIEIENDPRSVLAGKDPQLERAVQEVMKKLTKPVKLPSRPADPNLNKN